MLEICSDTGKFPVYLSMPAQLQRPASFAAALAGTTPCQLKRGSDVQNGKIWRRACVWPVTGPYTACAWRLCSKCQCEPSWRSPLNTAGHNNSHTPEHEPARSGQQSAAGSSAIELELAELAPRGRWGLGWRGLGRRLGLGWLGR